MDDFALVLNSGSSSLKFAVFSIASATDWPLAARGNLEGIGTAPKMSARDGAGATLPTPTLPAGVRDAGAALEHVFAWLRGSFAGGRLMGVGHRVVHGGPGHKGPAIVTPELLAELRKLVPFAPLHQPYNLAAIEAVARHRPDVPQVACFDTSFHRTLPAVARLLPLPAEVCRGGVERYGFHGLSYEYIASVLPQVAPQIARGRVIVAHLGSGASLCAMRDLHSVATTMGFSALDGLMMGTRCGALDPGALLYLMEVEKLGVDQVADLLYHRSGLLGVSGISPDPQVLLPKEDGDERVRLALALYVRRIVREIGALAAVLGGLDLLVFTAGIGEHNATLRERICRELGWLGIELDADANARNATTISSAASRIVVAVEPTNEEWIAAWRSAECLDIG